MGITKAPGDRNADTPEWICITNQRINPFKARGEESKPRKNRKDYIVESYTPGYLCTNIIVEKYKACAQTLRGWNRAGYVRTIRQRHATLYFEEDIKRLTTERRRTA